MVKEGQSCMLEQRRVIMAVTHMLDSGTLDERSYSAVRTAGRLHPMPANKGGTWVRSLSRGRATASPPKEGASEG
jgi:hypothetical protein